MSGPPWAFFSRSAGSAVCRRKRDASIGVSVKLTNSETRMAKATVHP